LSGWQCATAAAGPVVDELAVLIGVDRTVVEEVAAGTATVEDGVGVDDDTVVGAADVCPDPVQAAATSAVMSAQLKSSCRCARRGLFGVEGINGLFAGGIRM
jgi:hypothetical protein